MEELTLVLVIVESTLSVTVRTLKRYDQRPDIRAL
jgi:hypothetical protein